jgi:hypothetical protein
MEYVYTELVSLPFMAEVVSGLMETGTALAGSAMTEASAAVEAANWLLCLQPIIYG